MLLWFCFCLCLCLFSLLHSWVFCETQWYSICTYFNRRVCDMKTKQFSDIFTRISSQNRCFCQHLHLFPEINRHFRVIAYRYFYRIPPPYLPRVRQRGRGRLRLLTRALRVSTTPSDDTRSRSRRHCGLGWIIEIICFILILSTYKTVRSQWASFEVKFLCLY